jgi:hypothetical protein
MPGCGGEKASFVIYSRNHPSFLLFDSVLLTGKDSGYAHRQVAGFGNIGRRKTS